MNGVLRAKRWGTLIDFSVMPECHRGPSRKGSIREGCWFLMKRTKHCRPVDQKRGFEQRQGIDPPKKKNMWVDNQ